MLLNNALIYYIFISLYNIFKNMKIGVFHSNILESFRMIFLLIQNKKTLTYFT